MKIRRAVAWTAVVLALAMVAGCADVVNGSGSTAAGPGAGASASSTGPDFPGSSSSASTPPGPSQTPSAPGPSAASAPATPCPHVTYAATKLSFTCITSGMTARLSGGVWPLSEYRVVEPSTDWVLEEGAGHWGSAAGHTLGAIAADVREQMVATVGYGTNPRIDTVASKATTVDGAKAYVLQTTFTLNTAWAKKQATKVKQEKLWILAVQVGSDDVSLWYVSVPDLAKSLWSKVPSIITSIKVG